MRKYGIQNARSGLEEVAVQSLSEVVRVCIHSFILAFSKALVVQPPSCGTAGGDGGGSIPMAPPNQSYKSYETGRGGGQIMPITLLQAPPEYLNSPTALARELTWSYYEEQLRATLSSVYAVLKNL